MPEAPFFRIVRDALRRAGPRRREGPPAGAAGEADRRRRILVVGSPNVGKSVLFNRLTGRYATVSNYPGTTVEIARGRSVIDGTEFEVVDTPGMYSLQPISEEERVARRLLLRETPWLVIHVVDAKNLDRMLPLTLQLVEASLPVVLVVNMMDEAEGIGLRIDALELGARLGIPVVPVVALRGRGMDELRRAIREHAASH